MTLDREYKLKENGKVVILEEPIIFYASKGTTKYQIIYIPPGSDQYKKNNFAKIADPDCEIIVVKDPSKKIKYLAKQIIEYPSSAFYRNHQKAWDAKGQSCKILTNEEVANYMNIHKMLATSFPKLRPDSVEAIWYGLAEGNIVELTSVSISSAGVVCVPRRVSKTDKIGVEPTLDEEEED